MEMVQRVKSVALACLLRSLIMHVMSLGGTINVEEVEFLMATRVAEDRLIWKINKSGNFQRDLSRGHAIGVMSFQLRQLITLT